MNSPAHSRRTKPKATSSTTTVISTALASGAATLIVALAVGWLTIGRSAVGRDEVIELIASGAPYSHERQALFNNVENNTQRIDDLSQRLRQIEQQGHRVEAKLDLLLSEFARRQGQTTKDE